jgi:HK97 family phage portal protein
MGGALLEGRVSTVFSCVDLISRTLATLPIIGTKNNESYLLPPWHDNPEPDVYTSIVDAMKAVTNSMLMRGQAFIAPTARYADGTVARWVVLNPDRVLVEVGQDGLPAYNVSGVDIPRSEILHLRYQVWPGLVYGVSPLEAAWRNLISADALERWGTSLAVGNGLPTAVLQAATKLTSTQAQQLQTSWALSAQSRGTLPVVLSGGLTYTPLNLKPSDVGLLDLRTFDEQRIASCFGVPLWLVGLPMKDGLTYSTVSGTFDYFWRATLRAFSYNIMQGLSGFCLPRGVWARHDSEAFTQPDSFRRAQSYNLMTQAGAMTPAEIRVIENLPAVPNAESTATLAANLDGGL